MPLADDAGDAGAAMTAGRCAGSPPAPQARWSTSSFGEPAQASTLETSALREHLVLCSGTHRRWFRTRCAAEAVLGFLAARLVTSFIVATVPIALVVAGW